MAEENLYSLLIKVEGGDAAAAEIIKANYALKQVEGENSALKERFQEGFQHIALKGFLADAARGIGLGGEIRPIIGLLNSGITELGESIGLTATGAGLFLAALTALAGLAFVVREHFAAHNKEMAETLKGYKEGVTAIDEYVAAGGRLSAIMQQEAKDTRAAADEAARHLATRTAETLVNQEAALAMYRNQLLHVEEARAMERTRETAETLTAKIAELEKKIHATNATLEANQHGFATWEEYVKSGTKTLEDHKKAAEEAERQTKELAAELREAGAAANEEAAAVARAGEKMVAETEALADKTKAARNKELEATRDAQQRKAAEIQQFQDEGDKVVRMYQKQIDAAQEYGLDTTDMEKQLAAYKLQVSATVAQKTKENYGQMALATMALAKSVEDSFAQQAAHAIASGKSMHDAYIALSSQIKEGLIAAAIKWGLEYVASSVKAAAAQKGLVAASQESGIAIVSANNAVTESIHVQIIAVNELTAALAAATEQAIALDVALAAVAF